MALRLASKALCSAGTKTTKESLIERLATPSAKHSATSAQGTNRLIVFTLGDASHSKQAVSRTGRLAIPACAREVPRRGGFVDDTVIIERGFNGPRLSGNGGYVGGVMAGRFNRHFKTDGAVEITLRAPVPLETPLQVTRTGDALLLKDGATLLCEARAGAVAHLAPPPPPADWADVMRRGEQGGSPRTATSIGASCAAAAVRPATACACSASTGRGPANRSPATCRMPTTPTPRAASSPSSCGARSTVPAPGRCRSPTTGDPPSPAVWRPR